MYTGLLQRGHIQTQVGRGFCQNEGESPVTLTDVPALAYGQDGMYNEFDIESGHERRKLSASEESSSGKSRRHRQHRSKSDDSDEDGSSSAKRKRRRGSLYPGQFSESNDDTTTPVPVQKTQQLMIGDAAEVEKFYFVRFRDMQQSACKVMGKAFVKLVEPKKQTHHPYTKGDVKAPPWWPNTTGENSVRHKEPDHLLKPGTHFALLFSSQRLTSVRTNTPFDSHLEDDS